MDLPFQSLSEDDRNTGALVPVLNQLAIWRPDDAVPAVPSGAERRRLQNRLNQRARRKRQRRQEAEAEAQFLTTRGGGRRTGGAAAAAAAWPPSVSEHKEEEMERIARQGGCTMDDPATRARLAHFAHCAVADYARGIPRPAYLPTLVKYNVFSALIRNGQALGGGRWLLCDAVSPFGERGPSSPALGTSGPPPLPPLPDNCPHSLRPTPLQLSVPHRPWIDLFPLPRMRDNILLATMDARGVNGMELCLDLVEPQGANSSAGPEGPMLLVWDAPWEVSSWEASVAFVRKWGWLLRGCSEIMEATNGWRARRGESPLNFGALGCPSG